MPGGSKSPSASAAGGGSRGDSQAAAVARYRDYTQHHISPQRIQHHSFYAPTRTPVGVGSTRAAGDAGESGLRDCYRDASLYEDLQSYANEVSLDSSLYLPQQDEQPRQAARQPGGAGEGAGGDAEPATPFRNYASEVTIDSSLIDASPAAPARPENDNFWSRLLRGYAQQPFHRPRPRDTLYLHLSLHLSSSARARPSLQPCFRCVCFPTPTHASWALLPQDTWTGAQVVNTTGQGP